jgi:hypothetical protein
MFLAIVWIFSGAVWMGLVDQLDRGYSFSGHLADSSMWCVNYCLWIPTSITIATGVVGFLVMIISGHEENMKRIELQETDAKRHEDWLRENARREQERRLGDMNSTEFESALRRRLREWNDGR